jgi:hypothetical protein
MRQTRHRQHARAHTKRHRQRPNATDSPRRTRLDVQQIIELVNLDRPAKIGPIKPL